MVVKQETHFEEGNTHSVLDRSRACGLLDVFSFNTGLVKEVLFPPTVKLL